ncbi:MAG TPA: Cof-type HAD-IIB family hydrolase [Lachnospiraceae bacterium]|nr:Cof-type HAD-IIB family hydrolase [Lachnospiraceae bacterium]
MKKIKLIGLDLDGTLLNDRKELTPYTEHVLSEAIAKGVHVLAATGRPIGGIPERIRNFPGMRYAVTANGARIIDLQEEKILYEALVEPKNVEKILDVFECYDTLKEVYLDGISYVSEKEFADLPRYVENPAMRQYIRLTKIPVADVRQEMQKTGKGSDKVHALFADLSERECALEDLKKIPGVTVSSAIRNNIEVNGGEVDKGKGLLRLGKILGIEREEIMACGDGLNDVAMLRDAGLGVAMGNASAEVKAAADVVTCSNEEDGVAKAIEMYVL